MKKVLIVLGLITLCAGCNLCRYAVKKCPTTSTLHVQDSVFRSENQRLKDSLVHLRSEKIEKTIIDTVVLRELPPEMQFLFSMTDTVRGETSYSSAIAYLDRNIGAIILQISNKETAKMPVRYITNKTLLADTVFVYKENEKETIESSTHKEAETTIIQPKKSGFWDFMAVSGIVFYIVSLIGLVLFVVYRVKLKRIKK